MAQDPYRYFRVEARELLEQIGKAALELEKGEGGQDLVPRILRHAHTLKGAARVIKQREIADEAHAMEETLAPYRQGERRVPRESIDQILRLLDAIAARLSSLMPEEPSRTAAPARSPGEDALRIVRADVAEVDALLDGLAEAHGQLDTFRKTASHAMRARHLGRLLAEQLAARVSRGSRRAGLAGPGQTSSMAEELGAILATLDLTLDAAVEQMDRELRQVRDAAEHLRLVPVSALFTLLERTARDAAQSLGKQVVFEGRGGELRIDAHVLGAVQVALVQIVRNAVAHGIETVEERGASGKPPAGRVTLEIVRRSRRVVFRCQDDGRGVDLDAVRRTATRRGVSPVEMEKLGPEALVHLLLQGGISTSPVVTDVSGRGVGLDIVRAEIERLGGEVRVRTAQASGTTFELEVPLSLASVQGLAVESAGIAVSIPLDAIKRTVRVTPGDVSRTATGESLIHEGQVIPFVPLAQAFRIDLPSSPAQNRPIESAVVVEANGRLAALGVHRLMGTANIVLRPLPELAPADPIVAGASLDAEGNPQLVLDPEGIVAAAAAATPVALPEPARRPPVLVVDDSLTTRMLEQSILESAGYAVEVATSAEEALEAARRRKFALFLVDVEMPGMDGFTFIERVRAEPALCDIPAILVTSRASAEDRERGESAGAQGYIVKSEFDQSELLARIGQLVI